MGRPPAYIFIVRHGNRLDAADKLWHLSSPTPYDPPLTYGGWSQSCAIGQRIADILRENAPLETAPGPGSPGIPAVPDILDGRSPPQKRRYKIVIHSSPFLRCIQTSIAISSGIASDSLPLESPRTFEPLPPLRVRPSNQNGPSDVGGSGDSTPKHAVPRLHKSVMRLDAFLGEWLSPGYFELITPPPSSVMMVASAKAELLRREDYSSFSLPASHHSTHAYSHSTGQLWGASRSNTWSSRPSDGDELPKSGSQAIPPVGLFNSSADGRPLSSNGNLQSPRWRAASNTSLNPPGLVGYVAPVPHFALSSRAPTPTGYVAHARDACVDLDYQWDSMRAPYDWGDGGEFGEEWTSMHRRFRKGLQKLVDWYTLNDAPAEMVTKTIHFKTGPSQKTNVNGTIVDDAEYAIDDDDDTESDAGYGSCIEESVVILVSHGAGCNALIGAITQQPVLMDVGLASLSVAARKPGKEEAPGSSDDEDQNGDSHASKWAGTVHSGHPGGVIPLNQYYEMKLLASSDHLRSVPTTPTSARPSSMATVMGGTRGRHSNSLSGALGTFGYSESGVVGQRSSSAGSFHGNSDLPLRRPSGASSRPAFASRTTGGSIASSSGTSGRGTTSGITIGSGVTSFSPPSISTSRLGHSRSASIGLWSPVSAKDSAEDDITLNNDEDEDDDMEILLSFGPESPAPTDKNAASDRENKAPSTSGRPRPSALSISHSANGGENDSTADVDRASDATVPKVPPPLNLGSSTVNGSNGIGKSHGGSATMAPTTNASAAGPAGPASPSLWIHPRVATLSGDEPTREQAGSKRRWTVNEPPV